MAMFLMAGSRAVHALTGGNQIVIALGDFEVKSSDEEVLMASQQVLANWYDKAMKEVDADAPPGKEGKEEGWQASYYFGWNAMTEILYQPVAPGSPPGTQLDLLEIEEEKATAVVSAFNGGNNGTGKLASNKMFALVRQVEGYESATQKPETGGDGKKAFVAAVKATFGPAGSSSGPSDNPTGEGGGPDCRKQEAEIAKLQGANNKLEGEKETSARQLTACTGKIQAIIDALNSGEALSAESSGSDIAGELQRQIQEEKAVAREANDKFGFIVKEYMFVRATLKRHMDKEAYKTLGLKKRLEDSTYFSTT